MGRKLPFRLRSPKVEAAHLKWVQVRVRLPWRTHDESKNMLVDPQQCTLSLWEGDPDHCRWCNLVLGPRRRVWHDGSCMKIFREQHRYTQARRWCKRTAKGWCPCIRPKGSQRHPVCAHCGICEPVLIEQGLALECNHIVPRLGDKSSFSCLHHHDNLQMLCTPCHREETNLQAILYPEMRKRNADKDRLPR